jgi:hypothetical protein
VDKDKLVDFPRTKKTALLCLVCAAAFSLAGAVQIVGATRDGGRIAAFFAGLWLMVAALYATSAVALRKPYARASQQSLTLKPMPLWPQKTVPWASVRYARRSDETHVDLILFNSRKVQLRLDMVSPLHRAVFLALLQDRLGPVFTVQDPTGRRHLQA